MTPSTEYDSNASASSTGSRPRRRRRLWLSIAAAVVVVVIGGTYLTLRETVWAGPASSGLNAQWTDQRPAAGCGSPSRPWISGGLAVQCSGTGIAALRISTGRVAWIWHPPRHRGSPTTQKISVGTDSGIGVVEYTYGQGKDYVAGVEVATGRQLWSYTLKGISYNAIWVGQGRLAFAPQSDDTNRTVLEVRDLVTGKPDWSSATPGHLPAHCDINNAVLAGPWVYATAKCAGDFHQLYQLSLKTGKVIAHAPLLNGFCEGSTGHSTLWAVQGYVLLGCEVDEDEPTAGGLPYVITAGTVRQRPLSYTGNPPNVDFLPGDMNQQDAVASGNSLYVSQDITENDKDTYQIAAIDLKTARLGWDKTVMVPHSSSNDVVYPANLLGADSRGVLDAIEVIDGSDDDSNNSTTTTLATLSASDGHLSYGPGTTYDKYEPAERTDPDGPAAAALDAQPDYYLAVHTLLAFPPCGLDCTDGPKSYGPVIGYNTGPWPQSWTPLDRFTGAVRRAIGG